MVIDSFMFFNEFDLLEIRLEELWDDVDIFILTESNRTFSGKPKQLNFWKRTDEFKKYMSKIEYHTFNYYGETYWAHEKYQRQCLLNIAQRITRSPDDIFIFSDADEIPKPEAIRSLTGELTSMKSEMYYYGLNIRLDQEWYGPISFKMDREFDLTSLREEHGPFERVINDGSWHFSYCGGADKIREKINSFSHGELATEEILSSVEDNVNNLTDLFGRNLRFERVDIGESHPITVRNNIGKWKHLLI